MSETKVWTRGFEGNKEPGIISNPPAPITRIQEQAKQELMAVGSQSAQYQLTADGVLLDVSGSMDEEADPQRQMNKHEALIEAAAAFLSNLIDGSMVTVFTFAEETTEIIPLQEIPDKLEAVSRLYQIPAPAGRTFAAPALRKVHEQLFSAPAGYFLRAFLLHDGLPNDKEETIAEAQALRNDGIQLQAVGFGLKGSNAIDENLMEDLSSKGTDGKSLYRHFAQTDARGLTAFMVRSTRIRR